jgi:hypothetical protein
MATDIIARAIGKSAKDKTDKITVSNNINLDIVSSTLAELLNYSTVAAVADVYTIDFANSPVKNVKIETEDTNAKTVAISNVPTDAELFIELTYTNAAAITWFAGITWLSGAAPTFETGKVYRIALFKYGTGWHGNCVGGW